MIDFVGENPVVMSGVVVARRNEDIALGDGRGRTLRFAWTDVEEPALSGSPADAVVHLPSAQAHGRVAGSAGLHVEGKAMQVRYVVDPVDEQLAIISFTLFEDIEEMLREAEAPTYARRDASAGVRMSSGPDGT